jgi:UDP-N-acetylglucosamine acyltransferase
VEIGPGSIIGPSVELEEGVRVGAHVVIDRDTRIGSGSRIFHASVVGTDPQDLKYAGEATRVEIGERTTIREFVSVNRGTAATGVTRVGSDCLLMAGSHVAHDCVIGDHVVVANDSQIGGHVEVGDWAILGGMVGIHQFTRIGAHAFVGGASRVVQDVPPFLLAVGNPCEPRGINVIGLQRRGFDKAATDSLRAAYRTLFKSRDRNLGQAMEQIESLGDVHPAVESLLRFIRESRRGIVT